MYLAKAHTLKSFPRRICTPDQAQDLPVRRKSGARSGRKILSWDSIGKQDPGVYVQVRTIWYGAPIPQIPPPWRPPAAADLIGMPQYWLNHKLSLLNVAHNWMNYVCAKRVMYWSLIDTLMMVRRRSLVLANDRSNEAPSDNWHNFMNNWQKLRLKYVHEI